MHIQLIVGRRSLENIRRFPEADVELERILSREGFIEKHKMSRKDGWSDSTIQVFINENRNATFILECGYHCDLCKSEKINAYGPSEVIVRVSAQMKSVYGRRFMGYKECCVKI